MSWQPDDERLQIFLEEAREHLADIESDLLRIEQAGSRSPPELLNKVFRAVHSVKGGAGFFALKNTQELAHAMETVLGRIRGGELLPAPEIISVLLESADCLKRMVPDPAAFESRDVSAYLTRLNAILDPASPETGPEDPGSPVAVRLPDGRCVFTPPQSRLREALRAEQGGENLYVLELDVMQDIQRRGKTPAQVLRELGELTAVVDHRIDTHRVGTLETFSGELSLSLQVLLASGMDPGMFQELLGLEARCVHPAVLSEDAPDREAAVRTGGPRNRGGRSRRRAPRHRRPRTRRCRPAPRKADLPGREPPHPARTEPSGCGSGCLTG